MLNQRAAINARRRRALSGARNPPCEVTILSDRRERGPYGLCGGEPGQPGRNTLDSRVVPAKANFQTQAGAVLRIETPGGGGWGY